MLVVQFAQEVGLLRPLTGKGIASPCSRKVFVVGTDGGEEEFNTPGDSSLRQELDKHGHCIGGRGRRSAFYLGSALFYRPHLT